jgi:hypothetical protein
MGLSARQQKQLDEIIKLVEKVRLSASTSSTDSGVRMRRSRADADKMRKEVLAARAKGVSATKLAEKYGVSLAYIYMIKA